MNLTKYAASLDDVRAAAARIAPYAHRTPVVTCSTLDAMSGRRLFFKCEHLQKIGAFKFRGACNAVMKLDDEAAHRGVVTHSSGNHAQAIALSAKLRGVKAYIVMPTTASPVKKDAVRGYGGEIIDCEPTLFAREDVTNRLAAETGATLIHPFNHPDIIAGQGTTSLELLEQVDSLDAIIAPIGGGGLISGVTLAAKALNPSIRILGAEPKGADDAAQSKAAGHIIPQTNPRTIADGLLTSTGDLTFPVIRDLVDEIITVEESEIVTAMRHAWQRAKLLIEPSAAVAVAVALSERIRAIEGLDRVGVVLSGGNVNIDALPWSAK